MAWLSRGSRTDRYATGKSYRATNSKREWRYASARSTASERTVALVDRGWLETGPVIAPRMNSVFAGFWFPREVITVAVRWYLAARPCRPAPGDRWSADEIYIKVGGQWAYLYRAVDQHGQVIDVLLSGRRDLAAARRFFLRALRAGTIPVEVTTDRAPVYPRVLDELAPSALHTVEQHANNPVEADHGRLKAWLRPMRGMKGHRSVRILAAGHAFVQNLRRGHYEIATDVPDRHKLRTIFEELAVII